MTDSQRPLPRPNTRGLHAELRETSHGWVLTLRADQTTADALSSAGVPDLRSGEVTVRVSPNLVPGEAFDLAAVRLLVDDAVR